jgi:hypothetical protein
MAVTRLIASGSPTDVPPNFITTIAVSAPGPQHVKKKPADWLSHVGGFCRSA